MLINFNLVRRPNMAVTRKSGKKGGARKAGGRAAPSKAGVATAGNCLSLLTSTQIVQDAAGGPHDIDKSLEEIGFISDNQRRIFREDVFEGVLEEGCEINRGEIPNGADNTLREVRDTIKVRARTPSLSGIAVAARVIVKTVGCLSLSEAEQIVQKASNGPHGIFKTLEEAGLISANQRKIFAEDVRQQVQASNCTINISDIPNGPDDTLREVRDAIRQKSTS
jgi:hypothetical protein